MIEFLSSWAKGLGLSIVVISILEMLLPNNKTKKYIRMIMGIYILFTIISPFIENKDKISIANIDFENYIETSTTKLNQTSMDDRIEQLYIEELEKDITKKIEEKGYEVTKCKVNATIGGNEESTKIDKIKLNIKKNEEQKENREENNNIENKIVTQIQKIKPVETKVENINEGSNNQENDVQDTEIDKDKANIESGNNKITRADIQNIKKFLIEEYEVNEKCLEIN